MSDTPDNLPSGVTRRVVAKKKVTQIDGHPNVRDGWMVRRDGILVGDVFSCRDEVETFIKKVKRCGVPSTFEPCRVLIVEME